MKIKIAQKGWEGYTGLFGTTEFVDGISVVEVNQAEIDRLAAIILIEPADDKRAGEQLGLAARFEYLERAAAPVDPGLKAQTEGEKAVEELSARVTAGEAADGAFHTQEELESIATDKGIEALRKIGQRWNVKDRSINVLIQKIIKAQTDFQAAHVPVEEPVNPVNDSAGIPEGTSSVPGQTAAANPAEVVTDPAEVAADPAEADDAEDGVSRFDFADEDDKGQDSEV